MTVARVAEVFGPTLQGEGPSAGRQASFVRLSGCNLHCGWCDTPYTWDWTRYDQAKEATEVPVADLLADLGRRGAPLLVITGGEPLLQPAAVASLLVGAHIRGWRTEVETNGTIPPTRLAVLPDQFNVSVKLANNGADPARLRIRPRAIAGLRDSGRAVWKFVVCYPDDLTEVAQLVEEYDLDPTRVWIMPEGTTPRRVTAGLAALADPVLERGWNLTSRLHVLAWGDQRGR